MKHRSRPANRVSVTNRDGAVIGIDLGATGVRAAVLKPTTVRGKKTAITQQVGFVPLPEGAVVNGEVKNASAVTAALRELWKQQKFRGRRVVLGATSQQVAVRQMTLPNLPPDELRKALPFQARDVIALPMNQALLDFSPLGPPNEAANTVSGLVTGIPRHPIVAAVHAVEKAKLQVARVDLAPYGLLRSTGTDGPAIEALVDIGAHLSTILIHTNGIPQVVRVVPQGGAAWTAGLADRTDTSEPEAESVKRTIGLEGDHQAARALRDFIRPLVNELRGSMHFFTAQHKVTVERIALTGGSSQLPGLAEYISAELGIVARVTAPRRHVMPPNMQNGSDLGSAAAHSAIAVGLALGSAA